MNFFAFVFIFIGYQVAHAQLFPIGLFEGLLGNSGVATSESSAPSLYNPSLLSFKKDSSLVLGGNSLHNFKSRTDNSDTSGSNFSPSYLSSIDIFESYAHELFIANVVDQQSNTEIRDSTSKSIYQLQLKNITAGYSFAFPGFPMGFQTLLYNNSASGSGLNDQTYGTTRSIANLNINLNTIYFGIGISTLLRIDDYAFGVNFRSRAAKIYSKDNTKYKLYAYDSGSNIFFESEGKSSSSLTPIDGSTLAIGHSFKSGSHEFLTDSSFVESGELDQSYRWRQSYGYRLGLAEDYQFLCGLNHLINDKVRYFGQDAYYSTGFSWKKRAYRSSIGFFYINQKVEQDMTAFGLTFSSEFNY